MRVLQIDIETFSSVDLKTCGVYRYVESPDFEILLFSYAYDDDPVIDVDLANFEMIPEQVLYDLSDPKVIKTAYNASFERTCIAKYFDITCWPNQWRCTAVHALTLGLPGHLEGVAVALNFEINKDPKGKSLIRYFSIPCKPTKTNEGRIRNLPEHDPEKWEDYKAYNRIDVEVERAVRKALAPYPVPQHEWEMWFLDQQINDHGVMLDMDLVRQAIACDEQYKARLMVKAKELTGLENPNSVAQIKSWLADRGLETPDGLGKEFMPDLIANAPDDECKMLLTIRRELSKTSVDKYNAMERAVCADGRARGLLQFCGANRTWRWAGRLIQVQNLPQNKVSDLELAREILKSGDFELLELMFGSPPFILSQLIRTAFVPNQNARFIVSDFAAIEARVIAWAADEHWVLDVFKTHGKIYEATAAQMFKQPLETIVKGHSNYELRGKGKVATLACGYQGGPNALIAMGALKGGIPEEELPDLVKQWRTANPNIVKFWYKCENAAVEAIQTKSTVKVGHGIAYRYHGTTLFADLPSGRSLAYANARIKPDKQFGKDGVVYDGMDQVKKKWISQRTYGGKLVENLIQAIARDCLAYTLKRLDIEGYQTVMHVHDEAVLEVTVGSGSLDHVVEIMSESIPWAPGLPLTAAGFECEFYQKD